MPAWFVVSALGSHAVFSSAQPPQVAEVELFMVADGVNKDDNDVTAGDIITVCQPAEQKRALPGLPSCLGSSREREREREKD